MENEEEYKRTEGIEARKSERKKKIFLCVLIGLGAIFSITTVIQAMADSEGTRQVSQGQELEFVYPTEGMTFYANEPITVQVATPPAKVFQNVRIKYPGKFVSEGEKTNPPYEFDVYLPLQVGPQKIIAKGEDENGEWFTAEVTVNLIPRPLLEGVTITQLRVIPTQISFNHIPQYENFTVRGVFSNKLIEQEITAPIFGTTYQVKSGGESVVSVSPKGNVLAKGVGQTVILVSNNGKTVEVPVTVESINSPPVIEPLADITMQAGEVVEVPVKAADADGDSITIEAFYVPAFGQFTDNGNGTGLLRFAPTSTDREYKAIIVDATDNGPLKLQATEEFLLTVAAPGTSISDQDSDGVPDANDNCPAIQNADQANNDVSSLRTVCDD